MTFEPRGIPAATMDAIAELGSIVLAEHDLAEVLAQVALSAKRSVPGATDVSVTFLESGGPSTVASTGEFALKLDQVQYDERSGPCLDAASTTQVFRIDDMRTETRWPSYARHAVEIGAHSTLSIPVPVQERLTAALNIYSTEPNSFGDDSVEAATAFAAYAAVAIANAHYMNAATLAAQMQQAMQSRAVIEQAKGILMATHRCSADVAFGLLARMSQTSNRKLRDIATSLVNDVQDNG
jgi:GAF domain-containing protein